MNPTPTRAHPVIRFRAHELSLELIRSLRHLVVKIAQHDAGLAKQLKESASSTAANFAEGRRRAGKDRTNFFRIAAGSADESRSHLLEAEAWGYLEWSEIGPSLDIIDEILRIAWNLTGGVSPDFWANYTAVHAAGARLALPRQCGAAARLRRLLSGRAPSLHRAVAAARDERRPMMEWVGTSAGAALGVSLLLELAGLFFLRRR